MIDAVTSEARLHFGWHSKETVERFLGAADVDELLDLLEIVIEKCASGPFRSEYNQLANAWRTVRILPDAEDRINALCERHRFGYRFEEGEARKVGSPALDVEVVGPTLLAVQRPG